MINISENHPSQICFKKIYIEYTKTLKNIQASGMNHALFKPTKLYAYDRVESLNIF
jgi:hypothetical protein